MRLMTNGLNIGSSAKRLLAQLKPGAAVGDFILEKALGQGGMGAVFLARHKDLGHQVAVKFFLLEDAEDTERFQREALAMAAVDRHPNIIGIHSYSQTPSPYIVMDYVEGSSLEDVLQDGPLPLKEALLITAKLCHALDYVHQRGILHRDIKASNVMLRGPDDPVLMDFGLTRLQDMESLTQSSDQLGTPVSMAPEQILGKNSRVGPATDIWAVGVLMYRMLTARYPFLGQTLPELAAKIINAHPPSPLLSHGHLPREIEMILSGALRKQPEKRYQRASDMARLCEQLQEGQRLHSTQDNSVFQAKRSKAWLWLPLFLVLAAALGFFGWSYQQRELALVKAWKSKYNKILRQIVKDLEGHDTLIDSCYLKLLHSGSLKREHQSQLLAMAKSLRQSFDTLQVHRRSGQRVSLKQYAVSAENSGSWSEIQKKWRWIQYLLKPQDYSKLSEDDLLRAAYYLRSKETERAQLLFQKQLKKRGHATYLVRYGLTLLALMDERPERAQEIFKTIEFPVGLRPQFEALERSILEHLSVHILVSKRSHKASLASMEKLRPMWAESNETLAESLRTLRALTESQIQKLAENSELSRACVVAEEYLRLRRIYPQLHVLQLRSDQLERIASRAQKQGDHRRAFLCYIQLYNRGEKSNVPEKYWPDRLDSILLEIFSDGSLSPEKRDALAFELIIEASRFGVQTFIAQRNTLGRFESLGVFRDFLKRNPREVLIGYWRAQRQIPLHTSEAALLKAIRENIQALKRVLATEGLARSIHADSYFHLADNMVALRGSIPSKERAAFQKQIIATYKRALENDTARPDEVCMALCREFRQSAPREALRWGQRAVTLVQERYQKMQERKLDAGRPIDSPLLSFDFVTYEHHMRLTLARMAFSHNQLKEHDRALELAQRSLKIEAKDRSPLIEAGAAARLLGKDELCQQYKEALNGLSQGLGRQLEHRVKDLQGQRQR